MPSYAVLGATGNTGQALLRVLSHSSSNTIHAFCRSKSKLNNLSPDIASNPNVEVYESNIKGISVLAECIKNTHAVFLAVAVSNNVPGNTIAEDTAKAVVSALQLIRKDDPRAKLPKLVVLSAAPTSDHLTRDMPRLALGFLLRAESNIYNDLAVAEKYLREQQDWITTTFVKPGAISQDVQKGHKLSLDQVGQCVSFLDLAAGMVEAADSEGYDMRDVSVVSMGDSVKFPWINIYYVLTGIIFHYFPFMYRFLG